MIKDFDKLLDFFIKSLIPETSISIKKGNKIFGAFILNKDDLKLEVLGVNNEKENPLFHGEISTIINFFKKKNLDPKNYYFISSHEPCSMCLSAITWSGFDNFYYFFPYEDTSSSFNIPHDLNILKEVFNMSMGNYYTKNNQYWNSFSILNEINKVSKIKREKLLEKVSIIKNHYLELSNKYQHNKNKNNIPLN